MKQIPQDQHTDAGNDHRAWKADADAKRQSRFDFFVENHLGQVKGSPLVSFVTEYP